MCYKSGISVLKRLQRSKDCFSLFQFYIGTLGYWRCGTNQVERFKHRLNYNQNFFPEKIKKNEKGLVSLALKNSIDTNSCKTRLVAFLLTYSGV